eukprot:6237987-Heterocapsa_arctica.AAC.1
MSSEPEGWLRADLKQRQAALGQQVEVAAEVLLSNYANRPGELLPSRGPLREARLLGLEPNPSGNAS